jgi:hypothetical protein
MTYSYTQHTPEELEALRVPVGTMTIHTSRGDELEFNNNMIYLEHQGKTIFIDLEDGKVTLEDEELEVSAEEIKESISIHLTELRDLIELKVSAIAFALETKHSISLYNGQETSEVVEGAIEQ